jgi:predicted Zn-dependent protease
MNLIKFVIIALFIFYVPCYADVQKLADSTMQSNNILISPTEQLMGKEFMRGLLAQVNVCDDPVVSDYINNLGNKLVKNSGVAPSVKFHFFVVTDPAINAFAGPGGYIGVNSGLFLITRDESELAAVLAHEISHVRQHHILRTMEHAKEVEVSEMALLLAAALVGTTSKSDSGNNLGMAAATAAAAGSMQNMLSFSRSNEEEADRIGMETLYKSGFNPKAMPIFFGRMQQASLNFGNEIPAFLRTHPVTEERMADAENRASQFPKVQPKTSLNYYLVKARLRLFTATDPYELLNYFKNQIARNKSPDELTAANYGYALALIALHNYKDAEPILTSLCDKNPNVAIYQLALADLKNSENQNADALKLLQSSLTKFGNYYPYIVEYGDTLIQNKQANDARKFLESKVKQYPDGVALHLTLAEAYGKSNHLVEAYQERAKVYEMYGINKMAIIQLQQALRVTNISPKTKLDIQTKIKALQANIKN